MKSTHPFWKIAGQMRERLEDFCEDAEAGRSASYRASIREAREDYAAGRVKTLERLIESE